LSGSLLQFVKSFKYLGHIISDTLYDDDDIKREIRSMFTRANILVRRFGKCSLAVKHILFKTYCICLYDAGIWARYQIGSYNMLRSCYNKCIKLFFGYKRYDSVTKILLDLGLPSFNTVMSNSGTVFRHM